VLTTLLIALVTGLAQPPKPAAPATFEEWSRKADAARSAGNLTEAVAAYEHAVRLKPDWTEGHWYLATTYYELDDPARARDAFRHVLAAQPGNAGAWAFAGLCEFQLKSYDAALADLMKARDMNVSANKDLAPVVRYHTGILLTRFQQFELAQKILTEFSILGNDNPKVIEALGMATLRIPMLPEELPAGRREQVLLAGQGTYYLYAHAVTAAHRSFEELVRRYPDTPSVHYAYGVLLLNEDPDRGIEEFKKELALQPASVPSMLQIAFEYIKRSDWSNAKTWAAQAVDAAPDNFAARQAYGQSLTELGQLDEAIRQLEAGIKLAADSPNLHYTLARAYQKVGRTADAERERLEFARLDREVRAQQHGVQAVGGEAPATSTPAGATPNPKP
jgi:tetratricopeptide (TPR) repeat protein